MLNDPVNLIDPSGAFSRGDTLFKRTYEVFGGVTGTGTAGGGTSGSGTSATNCTADICVVATRPTPMIFGDIASVIGHIPIGLGQATEHDYPVGPQLICDASKANCSPDRVKKKINSPVCNIPGQRGTGPISPGQRYSVWASIGRWPRSMPVWGGRVTSQVINRGTRVINETTALHVFQGTVTRDYFSDRVGNWYVTTRGTGNSPVLGIDALNDAVGPGLFERVNEACRKHVEGGG